MKCPPWYKARLAAWKRRTVRRVLPSCDACGKDLNVGPSGPFVWGCDVEGCPHLESAPTT